jgi:predicted phage gp36 major capsid-like protein
LPARFRPRAVFLAIKVQYNRAQQFNTAGGASVWLPNLSVDLANRPAGSTGYSLIGYPASEASAMTTAESSGSKALVLGDPRFDLNVTASVLILRRSPTSSAAAHRSSRLVSAEFGRCGGTLPRSSPLPRSGR